MSKDDFHSNNILPSYSEFHYIEKKMKKKIKEMSDLWLRLYYPKFFFNSSSNNNNNKGKQEEGGRKE